MKLCSACLFGVECRYDGKSKPNEKLLELSKKEVLIPVCPEQLGGLSTPREPSERVGDKVLTRSGKDVTQNYAKGAAEMAKLAKLYGITEAILKEKSPSCGSKVTYDGSFTGTLRKGEGVATELLRRNGITVISEEEL